MIYGFAIEKPYISRGVKNPDFCATYFMDEAYRRILSEKRSPGDFSDILRLILAL